MSKQGPATSATPKPMPAPAGPAARTLRSSRRAAVAASSVLAVLCLSTSAHAATPTSAGGEPAPLPASDYAVNSACSQPQPGHAGCLALMLVPRTAAARARTHPLVTPTDQKGVPARTAADGAYGLGPKQFESAYDLPSTAPAAQTIAVVDAYDDPNAEADLAVYDREFGLPECTAANGCFTKVNQQGQSGPLPAVSGEWSLEVSLDIETTHAICQNCRVLLVEASSSNDGDLEAAENRAVLLGATEISNSWGGPELPADSEAFNHPGVAITAAAGDSGYRNWDSSNAGEVEYPASSPHVVAVGGTRLTLTSAGEWAGETVWNSEAGASGGGCSGRYLAPRWQQLLADWPAVGCGNARAIADVAADGDPYSGAAVYDSTPAWGAELGWLTAGGTSLASPIIAATFALAGGVNSTSGYAAQTLYQNQRATPGSFHNVASGSNGACATPPTAAGEPGCTATQEAESCSGAAICLVGSGYSGPAGVGTPNGLLGFLPSGVAEPPEEVAPPPAAAPPAPAPPVAAGTSKSHPLRISRLKLTRRTMAALRRGRVKASQVSFSFTASTAEVVRLTLGNLTGGRFNPRASRPERANVIRATYPHARQGENAWRLAGGHELRSGRYRLTLLTAAGRAISIAVVVR